MSTKLIIIYILSLVMVYSTISTKLKQCCAKPVDSFIMREFSGSCACITLQQKWKRLVDWIELEGGYINPMIELNYVNNKNQQKNTNLKFYSHEKGYFANIKQEYVHKINSKALLMQIPFSTTFSQFLVSKYIRNSKSIPKTHVHNSPMKHILFPTPNHFMPEEFPDWDEYHEKAKHTHGIQSIRGWLALGLAWLREYTHELLPWFQLIPSPNYLPITWDKFVRYQLLIGTSTLKEINELEKELLPAKPYINMLGLTQSKVKQAFAWIIARSFSRGMELIGGYEDSPVIPCGLDFFNHNLFSPSSVFHDNSFGQRNEKRQIIENLIVKNGIRDQVRETDFASNFVWMNDDIMNGSQIYINYGKYCSSASRFAIFGFIDEIHPYDFLVIEIDLLKHDTNYWYKYNYFKTIWNDTYTRNDNNPYCYRNKMDMSTWNGIRRGVQNLYFKRKIEPRIHLPPLTLKLHSDGVDKFKGNQVRFLRLAYLPKKYFDSFTISSIINDFEYDYLESVIDPLINMQLNNICKDLLNEHTNLTQDEIQLKEIEYQKSIILNESKLNMIKNITKANKLTESITNMDRHSVVLRYKIREKKLIDKCRTMRFEATKKYLKTVKRKKHKYLNTIKKQKYLLEANINGAINSITAELDVSDEAIAGNKNDTLNSLLTEPFYKYVWKQKQSSLDLGYLQSTNH